jgi:lipopolysaccharide transport system permease protein
MEYIIKAQRNIFVNWVELWRYRELFYFFTWRDIKIKYKQTVLGFLWAILQPFLMMVLLTLFFGRALAIPSNGLPYPVFVFSGLLIWNLFSNGLLNSSNSMLANSGIIKKIYFPRLIIPVSSILVALFDFFMAFVLFVPLLIFYSQPVALAAVWCWPAAVLLGLVASLGLGSWLSALNVKFRDFRYVIPFFIQLLFFVSPVIYPVSLLKYEVLKYILACSPIYAVLELFRIPLTGNFPDPILFYISLGANIVLLFAGLYYFRTTEDIFSDLA